jgi:hypothetical protein
LRDGSLVSSYRQRAQERVKKYYDWEHVVDRYEELFATMAGRSTAQVDDRASENTLMSEEATVRKSSMP